MTAIQVFVKKAPVETDEWYSVFNNTYWSAGPMITWTGSSWDGGMLPSGLSELGTWVEGFRPTKIRVTFTGELPYISIADSNSDNIAGLAATSGQEIPITFGSFDIRDLNLSATGNSYSITNIEFNADPL